MQIPELVLSSRDRINTDVAAIPFDVPIKRHEYGRLGADAFVTPELIKDEPIGIGDEIATVGLFANHFGKTRNIPIVRIGSVAAMPEEPILTKYKGYMDAYLVEVHSIGGLSGSPVFVNRPPFKLVKGKIKRSDGGYQMYLLGLVHGHFDIQDDVHDIVAGDVSSSRETINTGIAVVIPAHRIYETLMNPDLVALRDKAAERFRPPHSS